MFVGHSGDIASTFKYDIGIPCTYSGRNLTAVGNVLNIRGVYYAERDSRTRRNLVVITPAGRSGIIGPTIPLRASTEDREVASLE